MSNFAFSCIDWHFLKITVLTFFIISLVIFGLQRRTLSQIKALEILFWPCFIIFSPMINICWAIMSRLCIILWTFFLLTLYNWFLFVLIASVGAPKYLGTLNSLRVVLNWPFDQFLCLASWWERAWKAKIWCFS